MGEKHTFIAILIVLFMFAGMFIHPALSDGENSNNGLGNYCATCTATFDPAPGADVNLYTGSMSIAVPLLSLNGRNGLDLDISLVYNSQSDQYVGNELWSGGQASWAGTGWTLSLGSIRLNLEEDEYYLNLPGLASDKIMTYGLTNLEYNPYVDISYNPYQGWFQLIDSSGKKYWFNHSRSAPGTIKRYVTFFNESRFANGIDELIDYFDTEYNYTPYHLSYLRPGEYPIYGAGMGESYPHTEFSNPLNPGGVQACNYAKDHDLYPFYTSTTIYETEFDPQGYYSANYQMDLTQIQDTDGNTINITYSEEFDDVPYAGLKKRVFVDQWSVIDYDYSCYTYNNTAVSCLDHPCERPPGTPEYQWTGDYGCPYYGQCIPDSDDYSSEYVNWSSTTTHNISQGTQYTKMSYIDTITDSIGRKIVFQRANRSDVVDPDAYRFMYSSMYANGKVRYIHGGKQQCRAGECATIWQPYLYADMLLDYIDIKDQLGNLIERIEFEYEYVTIGNESWEKQLLLKNVTRKDPTTGESMPAYEFRYSSPNYRLNEISYPTGGKRTFTYSPTHVEYVDDGTESFQQTSGLQVNQYQVSSITDDDGMGNSRTTTYEYDGGNAINCEYVDYFDDECKFNDTSSYSLRCPEYEDQGFRGCTGDSPYLGYAKVMVNLPDNRGKEVHYFYNDVDDSVCDVCGNISAIPFGGHLQDLEYKTMLYNGSNVSVATTTNTYDVYNYSSEKVFQRRIVRSDKAVDGVTSTSRIEYNNGNGLARKVIEEAMMGNSL